MTAATSALDVVGTRFPALSRLERLVPLALVAVVFVDAVLSITTYPVGAFEDDAIYTLLGKALATGEGYRMISVPGAPAATHYPPAYPFLLSLLWRAFPDFPDNIVVFKFVNAVLLAAAAFGCYRLVRRRLEYSIPVSALIAFAAIGVMPFPQLAGLVLSEPLFIALLFYSLLTFERAVSSERIQDAAIAGALLGALCLVRTVGIAAVAAAVLVLLARRQFRSSAALAATSAAFVVPWQIWSGAHQSELAPVLNGKYGPYLSWAVDGYRDGGFDFARQVLWKNLVDMGDTLGQRVMPIDVAWLRLVMLVPLVVILVAGLVLLFKRMPALVLFCAFYIALLIAWPFHPYRFLLALWPVLVIAAATTIVTLWRWQAPRGLFNTIRIAALGAVAVVVAGHAAYNWHAYKESAWVELQRRVGVGAKPLVEWVTAYTQPDDVISSQQDVLVYLYTGRRGVPPSTFLPSQRLQQLSTTEEARWMATVVRTYQPRYLVAGWPPHVSAADALTSGATPLLRRAGSIPHQNVYERVVR